jgi:hypothetical protein
MGREPGRSISAVLVPCGGQWSRNAVVWPERPAELAGTVQTVGRVAPIRRSRWAQLAGD